MDIATDYNYFLYEKAFGHQKICKKRYQTDVHQKEIHVMCLLSSLSDDEGRGSVKLRSSTARIRHHLLFLPRRMKKTASTQFQWQYI